MCRTGTGLFEGYYLGYYWVIGGVGFPTGETIKNNMYRVSQNYPNMYFSTIITTALKPLKMWTPKFYEILIKRQNKMPHTSEVPSWPRSVTISGSRWGTAFPFCPSPEQVIIDKGHNPRFHNRAIGMKFAREPVNRVRNQLDISRTHIFQQMRWAKTKSGHIGELRWNRKPRRFPDATKVIAIVDEMCYQRTCKHTNNQT